MSDYHIPLLPGEKYHILSRAVGHEKLFRSERNYRFFLGRYQKYISPIADTYSYCLLPNHFHILVRIKEEKEINALNGKVLTTEQFPVIIMRQFSKMLNSYAKSYNKENSRKGSLFVDYLRRVAIKSDDQFASTVFYVHKNPVHHGYCTKMEEWEWSSYQATLTQKPTMLLCNEVLDWFGGLKGFIDYHSRPIFLKGGADMDIE